MIRYAKRIIEGNRGKMQADIALGTKVYELVEELTRCLPKTMKNFYKTNKEYKAKCLYIY